MKQKRNRKRCWGYRLYFIYHLSMTTISHTFGTFTLIRLSGTQKFLFLLRSDYKDRNPLHRDIVWWGLDIWEQIEESVLREMSEEIGITTTSDLCNLTLLGTRSRRTKADHTRRSTVLFYTAEIETEHIILSDEHTDYRRQTLDEAMELELRQDVVDEAIRLFRK